MKRRQFMKSVAATAAVPLVPAGIANALPVSAAQYAKAVEAANRWAYISVGNLKRMLMVDDATSARLIAQLQTNGVLGATGKNGVALTRKYALAHAQIAAKTAQRAVKATAPQPTPKADGPVDKLQKPDWPQPREDEDPVSDEDMSETMDEATAPSQADETA